ncbi:ABC transporter substrate-binding protein [Petrotoga sp. 9PWA.NaAc.5.4]|uniref:ABC transporter substrate-binding protein n=1 Tax=Petrotoga sp. 9PWA.NaAc.5.4 TaxID=1434328 RepID=UPI000CB3A20B|nr:ABC transporter substrate-binding protein [Petrotoga sp. 9PWA.NaAc.5.4]PNR92519.1 ABC transporter substrate-binding protein [Petrotoga sp. 9PWA.NaAc.5.4]
MKRIGVLVIFAILLISFLEAEPVKIVFWHNMSNPVDRKSIEESVQIFNERNPNIQVEIILVPGSETEATKLMTAIAGGTGPDVYYLDRFTVAQRAYYQQLEPLGKYLEQIGIDIESLKKQYVDFAIEECIWNETLYALPWDTDARVLYYNKKHFKEAGLDPEKPPKTIEELDEYADKLTKKAGNRYLRIGFVPWVGQGWPYTWGWAFDGEFYDPENQKLIFAEDENIIKSLEWQKTYADKYGIKELEAFFSAFGMSFTGANVGSAAPIDPFLQGQLSMRIDGNWLLAQIRELAPKDFEYGIAPIPYPEELGQSTTWAGGWSLVIPKGAKHPKEAAEFIHYMATEGQIKYAVDTAHLPTIKEAIPEFVENYPEQKLFADLLTVAKSRPPLPVGALLWDELVDARNYVLYGEKDAATALKDAQDKVQSELDKMLGK